MDYDDEYDDEDDRKQLLQDDWMEERELQAKRVGNVQKWHQLKQFFYDDQEQLYFGRDLRDWGRVVCFYGSVYAGIFFILGLFLAAFLLRVDEIVPEVTGMESPLQMNPGMTMRPVPDFESSLIRFEQGKPHSYKPFADHLQTFLWDYENENQVGENIVDCKDGRQGQSEQKVCRFDVNLLGDNCTWQKDYGYDEGQPCVLIKLNRIYGWRPELFTAEDRPAELGDRYHPDYIGVSCEGKYAADKENIGFIQYQPAYGFPTFFYPFLTQEGYRSPLVMVKFHNPANGVLINVVCKVWAKNIKHNYNDNAGLIKFELLVD